MVTTIIITYDYGIGTHAALYTSTGDEGHPFLYDPAGSYDDAERGTGDYLGDEAANISKYIRYQNSLGSAVKTYTFNTTRQTENQLAEKALDQGGARPFFCSDYVSGVIDGIGPFKNLPNYFLPGNLADALSKIPGVSLQSYPVTNK